MLRRKACDSKDDGTARWWIWRRSDLIAKACVVMTRNFTRTEWVLFIGDAIPYLAVCENLPSEPEVIATPTVTP
jgi:hypothetical protein